MKDIVTQLRNHIAITATFSDDGFGKLVYQKGPSPICQEAADEIERLRAERDEARREVCGFHHLTGFLAGDYANSRGWDCFKDHPRGLGFPPSVNDFKIFLEGQDKIFLDKIDRLAADEIERLYAELVSVTNKLQQERDEAIVLIKTIANDVDILSTRPANIIKLNDLVFHINEWGDAARKLLKKVSKI